LAPGTLWMLGKEKRQFSMPENQTPDIPARIVWSLDQLLRLDCYYMVHCA